MTRSRKRAYAAALGAALSVSAAAPAVAFEIFGIRLWGSPEEDETIAVVDPIRYAVTFEVEGGSEDLAGALEGASALNTGQEDPVSGRAGLLSRARGDYRRILAALYNRAYYGGEISILLDGREAADLTLDSPLGDTVPVTIRVRPGPRFRFGLAEIVNPPPPDPGENDRVEDAEADAFRPGAQADAGAVSAASNTAIQRWRQVSFAKARETDREVIADHATSLLDATIFLDPGRAARFGRVSVAGSRRVDPGFIAYMADIPAGGSFDPDRIRAAEERLSRLGVFQSIRIEEAETIAPDGALDLAIRVEDRPPRTIGVGGTVSTLDGVGAEAYWEHRNVFGRAERLRFDASVSGFGLSDSIGNPDYSLGVTFTKPGLFRPELTGVTSLIALSQELDNYDEESITAKIGLQRNFERNLTGEISLSVSKAKFRDFFGTREFLLVIPEAVAEYDRRDDTLNPTRGYYLAASARPFYDAEFGNFGARGTVEGRVYRALGANDRFVLAARGLVGSYEGPDDAESPPNLVFFAGGAGSVRGYAYQSIGVEATDADGDTGVIGGRGLLEGSGELRVRVGERWGGVGFLDAGYVTETTTFSGSDSDLRLGAGVGVRYFTGLGPLRVDVAAPLNPRSDDSAVALYIGIGQAF